MQRLSFAVLLLAAPLLGQTYFPHHNFTIGGGAGLPRGDLRNYFSGKFAGSFGYGYRFHQYFQADIGLDMVFGAASVRDWVDTGLGPLRIHDREYLLPLGGRAIAPLAGGRWLFSAGGGAAYMNYRESLQQPSDYFQVACPYCTSRSGWGYYALANTSVFLDRGQHWRFGVTGKVYRGNTRGDSLGSAPPLETRDHWVNIFAEFGVSF